MIQPWWWRNLKPGAIWCTTRLLQEAPSLRVTSAWRSFWRNLRVGGVRNSGHVLGWCVDFIGSRGAMETAAVIARSWGARQVLVHDVGSGLHLHVDWRGAVAP